jgi:Plasma-membrane choline transporter
VLSLITARRLLHLPRQIHTASSTLTLVTHILILNPFILALSPAVLLLMLISSLPFVTLIFRLLLYGYATKLGGTTEGLEWHLHAWANWAIVGTLAIWLWSWAVARGIMRTTCSSVIGAWYFAEYVLFLSLVSAFLQSFIVLF